MDKRHIIFLIGFLVIWAGVSCAMLLTNSIVAQNGIPIIMPIVIFIGCLTMCIRSRFGEIERKEG